MIIIVMSFVASVLVALSGLWTDTQFSYSNIHLEIRLDGLKYAAKGRRTLIWHRPFRAQRYSIPVKIFTVAFALF